MPTWTNSKKDDVLRELARANEALAAAIQSILSKDKAQAAEHVLDGVALKHAAVAKFPPIQVRNDVTIPAGQLFREWENKELFVSQAFTAGTDATADHSMLVGHLQRIIDHVLDLITLGWKNSACADHLRELERHLRNLKAYLKSGMGQRTEAERRLWWKAVVGVRIAQAAFLDCIYGDAGHGMSEVFLGLIDIDHRLADILDGLAEWERTGDDAKFQGYLRNALSAVIETKEELEEQIRNFDF